MALAAIRECGGEQEFHEKRRCVAIERVQNEMSHRKEIVTGDHTVVRALLRANAAPVDCPSGVAEIFAYMVQAWDHYEGAWRAAGKSPGEIA